MQWLYIATRDPPMKAFLSKQPLLIKHHQTIAIEIHYDVKSSHRKFISRNAHRSRRRNPNLKHTIITITIPYVTYSQSQFPIYSDAPTGSDSRIKHEHPLTTTTRQPTKSATDMRQLRQNEYGIDEML